MYTTPLRRTFRTVQREVRQTLNNIFNLLSVASQIPKRFLLVKVLPLFGMLETDSVSSNEFAFVQNIGLTNPHGHLFETITNVLLS